MSAMKGLRVFSIAALVLVATAGAAPAQTRVRPGFNLFTVEQDVELGKKSALEVEQKLPLLSDPVVSRYVAELGARLAAEAPGPKFAYHFKVVNVSEINAFALPGGFIYVHRGLLEKVRTPGELAGVMAHEIAHVALRHPTNQASKATLTQSGLGILGGLLGGRRQSTTGQVVGALGGFGMNALFLKFSRADETQADIVGAQIMARAGYDPMEMVNFFEVLRQQAGSDPSKVAQFLSDHPAPVDREARVRQEASLLGPVHAASSDGGGLAALQAGLRRLPPASAPGQLANAQTTTAPPAPTPAPTVPAGGAGISVTRPSTHFLTFRQRKGFFEIQYPDNWTVHPQAQGYGVTITPRGGVIQTANGRKGLACGVVVNHYVPFDGAVGQQYQDPVGSLFGTSTLEEAASDLVRHVMIAHPHLHPVAGSEHHGRISGAPSFSVLLSGSSPVTGAAEHVTVLTSRLPDDDVIYLLLVNPASGYAALAAASDKMVRSLRVNLRSTH